MKLKLAGSMIYFLDVLAVDMKIPGNFEGP